MPQFFNTWYGIALIIAFDVVALILAVGILYRPFFKRVFDIFGAIICLIVTLPAFMAVVIKYNIYKSKSGEENKLILKKQAVGKKEKQISLHYFNGENEQGEETEFGVWLKRSKLKKLPLLLDVLLGTLSFIGVKAFDEKEARYIEGVDKDRFLVKPGLINPLILSGDEETDYEEMINSDKKYAWLYALFIDLKILVAGLLNFTRRKGNGYLGKTREQGYLEYLLQNGQISQTEFDMINEMDA